LHANKKWARCGPIFYSYGAPGEIRTPGLLVRSRKDDFIGSYFSTT
jgi:hypothetical protein